MFEVTARLKIRDGELEGFKRQAAEMMRLTRELDTKTLRYDWFVSGDGTECEVREAYVDADALIEHAQHVFAARDKLFRNHAYGHDMTLYGEPSPALAALMERLADLVPFHRLSFFQGLEKAVKENRSQREEGKAMDANRKILDQYVERYNAGDLDGVMELYADDAVQGMPDGTFEGKSAIGERLAMELAACPDVVHTVRSFVGDGDLFADEWTFTGTHTGPFVLPGGTEVPPTGQRLEVHGLEVVGLRDGKIVLNTLYYDMQSVVAQMGLLPEAASA